MTSYLRSESRWAREQQLAAQERADDLRDPRLLRHKRDAADIAARRARLALREALRDVAALTDEGLPTTIARHERDRDHWRQQADAYDQRIEQTEGEPLFGQEAIG